MAKKQKLRANFRKNRVPRARSGDWTRDFAAGSGQQDDAIQTERVSGKGELTRKRTVIGVETERCDGSSFDVHLNVDESACLAGRVLKVFGLTCKVLADDGAFYQCAVRRILKTLSTDQRHVVAAGDRVWFRPSPGNEGIIERVDPRHGTLSRDSRGRRHIIVTNVDQLLILASADQPPLKPNLIDRFLITAEKCGIRPLICINKIDLVDPAKLMPLVGLYSQLGYEVLLTSAVTGQGVERLRQNLVGRESALAGQSGVGKSSLLNTVDPTLNLRVREVSVETTKGKHTTTTATLIPLADGGFVVDTPGIRQMQLWDVIPAEVAGYFRDFRPFVGGCRYPDCTHLHEEDCAVKDAVADGWLDERRYESYCRLFEGEE